MTLTTQEQWWEKGQHHSSGLCGLWEVQQGLNSFQDTWGFSCSKVGWREQTVLTTEFSPARFSTQQAGDVRMEMKRYTFTPSKSVWPVTVTSHFCLHCHGCGLPWWSRKGRKRWPQLTYLSIRKEEWRQIKPKEKKTTWKKSKRSNPQQQYLVCVRSHVWSNWVNLTFNKHAYIFISVCSPTREWNGDSTHSYSHSTAHPILTRVLTEWLVLQSTKVWAP